MHLSTSNFPCQYLFFFFFHFTLSFSDPRISESGLFCGANRAQTSNFVPTFVKEMEILSQLITTSHFATYQLNVSRTMLPIYAFAQCHHDLSQTDCLLCYAASRTRLPRCLPSLSARVYFDGCFLRYDNYSFYQESVSPSFDTVKCSSENATFSNYENGKEFIKNVAYAVGNVSRTAVKNNGFGAVEVKGVYALAQCWESVGKAGCNQCLEKAAKGVSSCRLKKEGRGMNAGCYLRYSTNKFFNHDGETGHGRGKSVSYCCQKS